MKDFKFWLLIASKINMVLLLLSCVIAGIATFIYAVFNQELTSIKVFLHMQWWFLPVYITICIACVIAGLRKIK